MDNLSDICVYDAKLQGNEFVGIKIEDDMPKVYFPLGYCRSHDPIQERKDILNLISVLSAYGKKSNGKLTKSEQESESFPIHAYIGVFVHYLNYGYYVENETTFKRGASGKINWNRTIKQIRPQVSENSAVYLDYIRKKNSLNENALITQIHKYCVLESYKKIGSIFNFPRPVNFAIPLRKELFVSVLREKIANTFNERNLMLFHNMLDILLSLAKDDKPQKLLFGTDDFEYVWEGLIDKVFGISNKQDFYPKCSWKTLDSKNSEEVKWQETEKSALRPDSIMIYGEKVFILDSKYYKYGATRNNFHLPGSGSILKQLAYAEYVETQKKAAGKNIYNAFIIPYNAESRKWFNEEKSGTYKTLCFGSSTGDWVHNGNAYEKIYGILLDVRSIMYHHPTSSKDDIAELANLIEHFAEKDSRC